MSQKIIKKLASVFAKQQLILETLAQGIPGGDQPPPAGKPYHDLSTPTIKPTVDTGKIIADLMKELSEKPEWKQATEEQKRDLASDLAEAVNALAGEAAEME
jgi:hypothetical protein